ncbi:hypothetical protein [Enterovirga rhinocerotis]|uniref:Uncharacterized protein n=1 Tax=Enterovirga rhinocerotis TaxID=1339210 RepID=A0A4R7BR61_9HYPH|nr:hypothetical protein [Enterovirga rhinocerotis]TDR87262.1 hypothetical protein EV668_4342 [Enterovirga rhinocerotis]
MRPVASLLPILALALGAGILIPGPAKAAGLLDFLFGRPTTVQPPGFDSKPLDVTVRPRGKGRRDLQKTLSDRAALGARERKPVLVKSIDPVANPDWYLKDPTLRHGDIVVLKTGPVVYHGSRRAIRTDADFVALTQSRLLSSATRRTVTMMASGHWIMPQMSPARPARRTLRRQAEAR